MRIAYDVQVEFGLLLIEDVQNSPMHIEGEALRIWICHDVVLGTIDGIAADACVRVCFAVILLLVVEDAVASDVIETRVISIVKYVNGYSCGRIEL